MGSGFISSYFGEREDPFDGQETFHKGVDFAGTKGSTVVAVAAGVVTWAGERSGFGKLVEINHGDGYVTRYAHNERTLVSVGRDREARASHRRSWAPPAVPPVRTCTSKCCATAARSTRCPSSGASTPAIRNRLNPPRPRTNWAVAASIAYNTPLCSARSFI